MSGNLITPGGNPVCEKCNAWYGIGVKHECKHNHVTRDIKPRGKCPACDAYHDRGERGDDDG